MKISEIKGVSAAANEIQKILRTIGQPPPFDIEEIAREISSVRFPDEPITQVIAQDLPGFEGMLTQSPHDKEWAILYNPTLSKGRINFTLAHEFGHYMLHRTIKKDFKCGREEMLSWSSEYGKMEAQANKFASTLLMPIDDYRKQISDNITLDFFRHCADRYNVSLTAAILKWLDFTEREAVLIVSCDGFMKWSWSSEPAMKKFLFFKTSTTPPIEVPELSLTARRIESADGENVFSGNWWPNNDHIPDNVKEITLFSNHHDFDITLLIF